MDGQDLMGCSDSPNVTRDLDRPIKIGRLEPVVQTSPFARISLVSLLGGTRFLRRLRLGFFFAELPPLPPLKNSKLHPTTTILN